jgi:hypothetical protein
MACTAISEDNLTNPTFTRAAIESARNESDWDGNEIFTDCTGNEVIEQIALEASANVTAEFDVSLQPMVTLRHFGGADFRISVDWTDSSLGEWREDIMDHEQGTDADELGCAFMDCVNAAHPEFNLPTWDRTKVLAVIDDHIASLTARIAEADGPEFVTKSNKQYMSRLRTLRALLEPETKDGT